MNVRGIIVTGSIVTGSIVTGSIVVLFVSAGLVDGAEPFGVKTDPEALRRAGHLLNRAAFGVSFEDLERVLENGADAWIAEQLEPGSIRESAALKSRFDALTEIVARSDDRYLVRKGELWRYRKGGKAPPSKWYARDFDDAAWDEGPSGFGYGDDDDTTVLDDMRNKYGSLFIRKRVELSRGDIDRVNDLVLRLRYDDAFVAFLNGVEVARDNLDGEPGKPVPYTAFALKARDAGGYVDFDISSRKDLLRAGENTIALQIHNRSLRSSDLTIIPELVDRRIIPGTERRVIRDLEALEALPHVYARYSRRQLQTVLALFWENHFTTDVDKVSTYLNALRNSDASDALSDAEAEAAAARMEHREFEYFRENALGNFGDLLRYSATSPTMLIYLDNVLNVSGNANENYAREILELHTFGVDNGYDQIDIEQLSKCFTGWGVGKCRFETVSDPHGPHGARIKDSAIVRPGEPTEASGVDWRYFKGRRAPPFRWNAHDFDDSDWPSGPGGIGYGDGDDATVLADMRGRYTTVYLRKSFAIADPEQLDTLIFRVDIDDGFIAYINGFEVARFNAARPREDAVRPPVSYKGTTPENHEAGEPLVFNVDVARPHLVAGKNVLAIHAINRSLSSSDLTVKAELLDRVALPGSVENGDAQGVFAFRFFPKRHNAAEAKTLFKDSKHELSIPAAREGRDGILDAEEGIRRILEHPSTAVFICSKLIQRFVSDEIDFRKPEEGPFAALLSRCIEEWNATKPKGNIKRVMKTILSSKEFWSERAFRAKVKDPFEFVASTTRALDADTSGLGLPDSLDDMGMALFTRDDPDGWPEHGGEWVDTGSFQSRMAFAQTVTETEPGARKGAEWDAAAFFDRHDLAGSEGIVNFFETLFFQGTLHPDGRRLVIEFLTTDSSGAPLPLSRERPDFLERVRRALGFMLSLPDWQFQ